MDNMTVDLDFDKNMNAVVVLGCPQCKRKSRIAARTMLDGREFPCGCGFTAKISGNEFNRLQRSLDDLNRALNSIGR